VYANKTKSAQVDGFDNGARSCENSGVIAGLVPAIPIDGAMAVQCHHTSRATYRFLLQ
jgi:hypothetical protein